MRLRSFNFFYPLLAIILLSSSAYLNSLSNEFIWDDIQIIKENTLLRSYDNVLRIVKSNYWDTGTTSRASGNYRPLTVLTFLLNYQIGGDNPEGFRFCNIVLHAVNSCLVFSLALLLGLAGRFAFCAAILFALHPVHVEPVVWIVGRGELLACFFLLASLLLFILYLKGRKRAFLLFSLILFLCGLFSKESAVTLPILIFGVALIFGETGKLEAYRNALLKSLPYVGVVFLYLLIRYSVLGKIEDPDTTFFYGYSSFDRFLTMTKVLAYYWYLLFFPVVLRAHYDMVDFPVPTTLMDGSVIASGGFHLLAFALMILFFRKQKYILFFSLFWVYVALLPYMQIIPFQWVLGERFLYIPSVGFSIMFFALWQRAVSGIGTTKRQERLILYPGLFLLFSFLLMRTLERNTVWKNEVVFYQEIIEKAPTLAVAHGNLGYAYLSKGDLENAEKHYRVALKLRPDLQDERRALQYIDSLKRKRP